MEKFTVEDLFGGRLRLSQPQTGYRYTIDPVILSAHLSPAPNSRILDIGCGCGIMSIITGFRYPGCAVTGIEIQAELARIAAENAIENRMAKSVTIIHGDIRTIALSDIGPAFDLIISNPPYKKAGTGRLNPDTQKAIARHELKLTIEQLFCRAEKLLATNGRIVVIFPSERVFDLYCAMAATSISPEWLRFVHPIERKDAKRVIVSGVKNIKSSCRVLPPLHLYDSMNKPTKAYNSLFNP